jgi:TolB-like protein/Flp pilus assembly protein TadD
MKRCPECRRDYYDDSLLYCLDDGSALLEGPGSGGESPTAMLYATGIAGIARTKQLSDLERQAADEAASGRHEYATRHLRRWALGLVIAGLTGLLIIGGIFGYRYLTQAKQIDSIAVMPFVNDSGNADLEYLSDGMTETLISSLSKIEGLGVKGRSSVFRYKGKEADARTLGRELNVQALLNGRVSQRGEKIELNLELIDTTNENVIWSDKYDRRSTDLVTLQAEIARDVSGKLKSTLTGADMAKVTRTYTADPEAFRLYLKGTHQLARYNEDGYKKAIEYFKQAIEIDPGYALAYLGVADAYNIAADWYLPPKESLPKSNAAAMKALELDDSLAGAHYLLGINAFWHDWDWDVVERETRRANELDPSFPPYYAVYLACMKRFDQAIAVQEERLAKNPLDPIISNDLELIYLFAGQPDKAIGHSRKTLELDPNFWQAYYVEGLARVRKGEFQEAVVALEKARPLDASPSIRGYLGHVYAKAGRGADAKRMLQELKVLSEERYVSAYCIAMIYAGLNDKDAAFELLEKAYSARASALAQLAVDPVFDGLRSDQRFKDLLKRMNLPG